MSKIKQTQVLSQTESQQTLNDRQIPQDPDPYSENKEMDLSSITGENQKRKLDKDIFYQFTHGSHPDLHSNQNLQGSRSDLASVVKAGHAPSMTPNTMALNDNTMSR